MRGTGLRFIENKPNKYQLKWQRSLLHIFSANTIAKLKYSVFMMRLYQLNTAQA